MGWQTWGRRWRFRSFALCHAAGAGFHTAQRRRHRGTDGLQVAAEEGFNELSELVEIIALALANIGHGVADVAAAVSGGLLGEMSEHLHGEAAVEAVGDLPPPGAPHDLRGH